LYSISDHHSYCETVNKPEPKSKCINCTKLVNRIQELENQVQDLKEIICDLKSCDPLMTSSDKNDKKKICIDEIKGDDKLMELHTGVSSGLFSWVYDEISEAASKMRYWGGSKEEAIPAYMTSNKSKPGPKRKLSMEEELLVSLMYLKLNVIEEYMAFLFDVSCSTISDILSTWLPMLALELRGLIYWPCAEEIVLCYPKCFERFEDVVSIVDCFEIFTEKPSHAENNTLIFSSYKNHATVKFLISCTPGGTINFLSAPAGGNMSDTEIFDQSNIVQKCKAGEAIMADKGFRVERSCLQKGVRLIIPKFVKKGKQFTEEKNEHNKHITNARIHIERVIGRLRDYHILTGILPSSQLDLIEPACVVCCALTNIKASVVPFS